MLSPDEKKMLLLRARRSLERAVGRSTKVEPLPHEGPLTAPMGAFVTLHTRDGALRGCIGTLTADRPLALVVDEMAASAATRDPRFSPLEPGELDDVRVEISVLTPMEAVRGIEDIQVGRDGLLVSGFGRRGVLLPQVATEHGLDAEAFVEATCKKAGLAPDAWRAGLARVEKFRAEVFSERAGPLGP